MNLNDLSLKICRIILPCYINYLLLLIVIKYSYYIIFYHEIIKYFLQVLNVTQCQLCGNRTVQKFEVDKSETHEFQLILDDDHIPYIINDELLICKACRVYLLWRSHKETNIKDQQVDFVKHQDTIIRR